MSSLPYEDAAHVCNVVGYSCQEDSVDVVSYGLFVLLFSLWLAFDWQASITGVISTDSNHILWSCLVDSLLRER